MTTHNLIVLILGIIVAALGLAVAVMAAPPKTHNAVFWSGAGRIAAGAGLIVIAIG
jgi:hypothetical protein